MREQRRSLLQALLFSALVLAVAGYLPADIAPENYAKMQDSAPEYLTIEPATVRKGFALFGRTRPVTVTARVVTVFRSATGIADGDTITIRYTHHRSRRGWAGPRLIPILQRGIRYPAYLEWDAADATFRPAALDNRFRNCSGSAGTP
jgi:hypothetical protein